MPKLFETASINGMALANRFVRSATWEGLAGEDGSSTTRLEELSAELASGGAGLVITGHAYVRPEGQASPWQLGAYSDELVPALSAMVRAAHSSGGRLALQLAHGGCAASEALSGLESLGPSVPRRDTGQVAREMTEEDLMTVTQAFAEAARRALQAGFDTVQIHAAHGYLLSQFLSPFWNRRTDGYGGTVERRARLVLEVVAAVRRVVGPGFPVIIKLNSQDFLPEGLTVEEMLETAAMLEDAGIDAIELSGGTKFSGKNDFSRVGRSRPGEPEAYYEAAAKRYKEKIRVPLMLVGGIRSYEAAQRLITEGLADYVAMSRPLIREPRLVERWRSGDLRPALCISDNGCRGPAMEGNGIFCVVEARGKQSGTPV